MLHVRDASDEQLGADSDVDAVAALDFAHVNPVSGPVEVRGARAGDVLEVEILEFAPARLGLDGDHPRLRPARRRVPRAVAADLPGRRREPAASRFVDGVTLPYRPFPGTIGVAPREPGAALDRAAVATGAATSTSSTCAPAPRCTCPSASRARCSRSATPTPRWATARSAARRSRRRWTSRCGCRCAATCPSPRPSTTWRRARWPRPRPAPTTSARAWRPT